LKLIGMDHQFLPFPEAIESPSGRDSGLAPACGRGVGVDSANLVGLLGNTQVSSGVTICSRNEWFREPAWKTCRAARAQIVIVDLPFGGHFLTMFSSAMATGVSSVPPCFRGRGGNNTDFRLNNSEKTIHAIRSPYAVQSGKGARGSARGSFFIAA